MVLGWIKRLLYPFYDEQLSGKKYTVMGYRPRFHFSIINAFQSFKLGSYLLKSLPFTMANAFQSNYSDSEVRKRLNPRTVTKLQK